MRPMKSGAIGILMMTLTLATAPAVMGQSADLVGGARDSVRVMRHPNGARSIYSRQSNMKGMRCSTYQSDGRLVAVNDYIEGRNGELVACNIYDHTKRNIIYRVAYGYDSSAKLIEERMYTNPEGKLVQRVIYKYDADGKRSKPIIVSLNPAAAKKAIAPTMSGEVESMHRQLKNGKR